MPFGIAEIDDRLGGGELRAGALHEVAPGSSALADDAAATLFVAGIAAREASRLGSPVSGPALEPISIHPVWRRRGS